jgi:hypothetical protein
VRSCESAASTRCVTSALTARVVFRKPRERARRSDARGLRRDSERIGYGSREDVRRLPTKAAPCICHASLRQRARSACRRKRPERLRKKRTSSRSSTYAYASYGFDTQVVATFIEFRVGKLVARAAGASAGVQIREILGCGTFRTKMSCPSVTVLVVRAAREPL